MNAQATAGVDAREQGLGAVGVAVVSAVRSSHTTAGARQADVVLSSIHPAMLILIPVALVGVVVLAVLHLNDNATAKVGMLDEDHNDR